MLQVRRGCKETGKHAVTRRAREQGGEVADTHIVIGKGRMQGGR